MASGRIRGFWRRISNALVHLGESSDADPGMDTPERTAEKKQDAADARSRYPGASVPPAIWGHGKL
jgi:hypothetical protein